MLCPALATLTYISARALAVTGQLDPRNSPQYLPSLFGPTIDLGYTTLIGNDSLGSVHFFGGIPYIQPPLGDLRWRAPRQLDESPSGDVLDARNFGEICIQQPAVVGVGAEDCVTLNVWKPADAGEGSNLPVYIYIHGGGNYYNSAQGFPMAHWVNISSNNIIAVNIQYRLGLLGFLASSEVIADGTPNAGLLDQRAAMEWVQRHISKFGGDPTRVTIGGESSGGGSVLNHLVWQGGVANPPFSAAVLESIGNDPFPPASTYQTCYNNVTHFTGCDQVDDTLGCLRNTSVRALIAAVNHRPQPFCKYLPIVDGSNILDFPSQLVKQGKFAKVPVLAGHTTNDGTTFTGSPTSVTNDTSLYQALTTSRYTALSNATFQRALAYYDPADYASFYDLAQTLVGDTQFTCLDWYLVNQTAKYGKPAYNYRWNTPDPVQLAAAPYKGVMHTSELYFLYEGTNSGVSSAQAQNTFKPFNATEAPLATEAVSYWTSFVRSADPSAHKAAGSPDWPALDAQGGGGQKRIVPTEGGANGTATVVETLDDKYIQRCLFWISVANETRV